jgi:thioredoxin-related protein
MKPIVNGLTAEYEDRVEIVKLDIDDPKTAEMRVKHKFRVQPCFVLLDAAGETVKAWSGYTEKAVFDEAFASVLGQ